MQKYKAKKEVVEQVTSKLKSASKVGNLAENDKKTDLETENSKLQANKNIFSRGDFDFEKSFNYIKRWFSNGEWHYEYPPKYRAKENRTETKNDIAKTTKLITGIKPLNNPTEKEIDEALVQLSLYAIDGKLKCKALGNHSVYITERTQEHIKETHNEPRTIAEMKHKAKYIPFVPEILKNGKISEKSSSKEGVIYGVIGQVEYYDDKKKRTVNESVELAINFDKDTRKFVFSFADKGIKKSLFDYKDLNDHFSADPIVDTETVPITICRISEYTKMSSNINKSLTYSGHKLQGRTKLYGMDISIENKKGSYRSGVDSDGHKWKCFMNYDYGYIRGTVGTDGDHIDCISPETKILMANYTEKKAENICIGDELIGISLETKKNVQRKQIKTKVVNISKGVQDMLEITLSNGVTLKTTLGHLHYKFKGNSKDKIWKRADELNIGDKLVMIFNHHDLVETNDYKKGYLFGAYLGDGSINYDDDRQVYCDIRKGVKYSDVIYRVKKYWNDLGIDVPEIKITEPRQTNSLLKDGRKIVSSMKMAELIIRGINRVNTTKEILTDINKDNYEWCRGFIAGIYDTDGCLNCRHEFQISQTKHQDEFMPFVINCLEILGYKGVQRNNEIKINSDFMADNITMELTQLLKPSIEQKRSFIGQSYRFEPIEIIDIKPYRGEFIAIQTDEQTYIANGFVTHNCYIGPAKDSNKVYVIHQNNPVTHKYDEDKCMLCFESADAAKKAYMKQYDRPGFFGSMDILTVEQFKSYVFSKQGKRIHKSFDVTVTDITENNKTEKVAQLEKSLNAIADGKPFVIKHIAADDSKRYDDVVLRITNFDRNKIEKAVHKMAMTLDADIKSSSKGEAFTFKAQEELTDRIVKELTQKTNSVYQFVIDYFDLPEIRIVSKANLKYKGKTLYNPETGKPIKKSEWDKFVKALEQFLNRNYNGIGEKIVLSSESLGRILERLSKNNDFAKLKKMSLEDMKINTRGLEWISASASNMVDAFGETVSRENAARIEVAIHSAAIKVTKITDNMRNDIQDIIIDGIKNKESKTKISQNLFDKCVGLNRDFQKIADTEIQNNTNIAYLKEEVYHTKENEKVYFKRFEILDDNTCKKCKKIKEIIALWSDVPLANERIKDEYADYAIWEGKESGEVPVGVMHPYCYSDDTEVMTNNGWKLFKDVLDDDLIMSINPDTHEIDFVPFINRIQYQYNGEMIHFPGRNFDMLVTPNHNMLIEERKSGKWHGVKAEDLIDKTIYQIPRARGFWNGSNSEKIKIGCVEYSYIQYIKLWAWYLSEGSGRKRSDNAYEIKLAQKNINKILDDIPEFSERFVKGKEALYCTGKIAEMFEQMYGIYAADKYIPDFIKNSSAKCIRAFLYSFNLGDGSKRNRENIKNNSLGIKKSNDFVVRTSSKKMADDLCELIIKAGWMPSIHVTKQKGKEVMFRNGTYKLNTDCYVINICKSKNKVYSKHVHPGHPESHLPYKLNYNGMVYDVELEKWHFLLVKRNGKCGWSGNCRGGWFRYYPEFD